MLLRESEIRAEDQDCDDQNKFSFHEEKPTSFSLSQATSIFQFAIKQHVFHLVAHIQSNQTRQLRMKQYLAAFLSNHRLAVNHTWEDEFCAKPVFTRRLVFLQKNSLSAFGQQISIVLEFRRDVFEQRRV